MNMFFRNFSVQLLLRSAAIMLTAGLALRLVLHTQLWMTSIGLICFLAIQCYFLGRSIRQINLDVDKFLMAVKMRDHAVYFDPGKWGGSFTTLFRSFNDIIEVQKNIAIEKESVFQLFRTILEKVHLGVLVVNQEALEGKDKQDIVFMNQEAGQILGLSSFAYWYRLKEHVPDFAREVTSLRQGGKRLTGLQLHLGKVWLFLEVQPLQLFRDHYLIITFQDFRSEIEQKEMEAWEKLMEILTHEILNSITPISSLAGVIHGLVNTNTPSPESENLTDLRLAADAIKRRSEGLLSFVRDYQQVAELPTPQMAACKVSLLFMQVITLMQPMANQKGILLKTGPVSSGQRIRADAGLIEQVLINLVTNSIHALEGIASPFICLEFHQSTEKMILEVIDNGRGIPIENLERIFIPFFTTRENGSGIGLTISKRIMKLHQGQLEVSARKGGGTVFSLVFQ